MEQYFNIFTMVHVENTKPGIHAVLITVNLKFYIFYFPIADIG
jgi:hypothetical protein